VDHKLVVELDGGSHEESDAYDAARPAEIETWSYCVVRFTNE